MNNLKSNLVPYQIALDMKSIGFDEPCFGTWDRPDKLWTGNPVNGILDIPEDIILAPLYQQAFSFFREKYGIYSTIRPFSKGLTSFFTIVWESDDFTSGTKEFSYEEAELECLKKLIEIVKKNECKIEK
jgi:hypothetical protein